MPHQISSDEDSISKNTQGSFLRARFFPRSWPRLAALAVLCATARIADAGFSFSYIGKDPVDPGNFFVPGNWTGGPTGTIPGADDSAAIGHPNPGSSVYTTYSVRAVGTVSVKNLTINNASALSFNTLSVSGVFNLGDLPSSGADLQCLGFPGELKITGTMNVSISGHIRLSGSCIFENFGTVNLGTLAVEPGAAGIVFNNMSTGIVEMGDGFLAGIGGGFTFNNYGFLRKASSLGVATINTLVFANFGTVEVGAGTLTIGGTATAPSSTGGRFNTLAPAAVIEYASPWTMNDQTRFTGPGTHLCSGSMELHGDVTIGFRDPTTQLVTAGNFELTGAINGPGNLRVISDNANPSALNWTSGSIYGTGLLDVDAGGTINISGSATKYLGERTINNSGMTTWAGRGGISAAGGSSFHFNNLSGGLFEIQNDQTLSGSAGAVFNNQPGAVFRKTTATHVTIFNPIFNNHGLVDVQTGIVQLAGGGESIGIFHADLNAGTAFTGGAIFNMNGGTAFTGDGLAIGGNATVVLNAPVQAVNYSLLLGVLDGPGDLSISHDFDMGLDSPGGCTLSGAGEVNIAPTATFNITGSREKSIVQRQINNAGTTIWVGVGRIAMSQGAIFNNKPMGVFFANSDAAFQSAGGAAPQFINAGQFIKTSSAGVTSFDGPAFINSGFLQVLGGTLEFRSPPFVQTAGSINLDGGILKSPLNAFEIQGGSLFGSGSIIGSIHNTGGVVSPGHSPGAFAETGDFSQSAAGALTIQINGATGGTGYDQLTVSGAAALGGALRITVGDGFSPAPGQQFPILTSASRIGTFTTMDLPQGLSVNYTGTGVFVSVTGPVPVQILTPQFVGGALNFSFNTIANRSYTVQSTSSLTNPSWTLFQNVTGNGSLMQFAPPIALTGIQFFRVTNP